MKLLIVAGPYEADRIRRAAVSAGGEAVAVEPGESLSGWITATRPDVVVAAPRVISADPATALAKIRAVPRGRVPILLVGDAEEESELRPMADGFFVRPIAADDLIHGARAAVAVRILRGPPAGQLSPQHTGDNGSLPPTLGLRPPGRAPALKPLVAVTDSAGVPPPVTREVPAAAQARPVGPSSSDSGTSPLSDVLGALDSARAGRAQGLLEQLADEIDAHMDADLAAHAREVFRAVDGMRASGMRGAPLSDGGADDGAPLSPAPASGAAEPPPPRAVQVPPSTGPAEPPRGPSRPAAADQAAVEALIELTDESSQKTVEVPQIPSPLGDEVALDPPGLLARMYLSRLSGRLTVRAGSVKKYIVFERGHPVLAGSNRPEDRLGEMLVRQGRLRAEQASTLGDEAAATGRRLGLVLVDRGLIAAAELTGIVRRHYEELIHSIFPWQKGAWTLGTDGSIAAEKVLLSLHPAALIFAGIRRGYGDARTIASLGGTGEVFQLRPWPGLGELLDKMGLDPAERRLVLHFDGVQSLAAIASASGLAPERVNAVAWALFVLDRLEPAPIAEEGAGAEAARRRGAVSTTAGGFRERDEVIDRALVQARAALVADGDYFQILGVPRDAGAEEIRRAHEALSAGLAPGALHPVVAADLEGELREIRAVLDEATGLLLDDRLRQAYRDHLATAPVFRGDPARGA